MTPEQITELLMNMTDDKLLSMQKEIVAPYLGSKQHTVDCTPTWSSLVRPMLMSYENQDAAGRRVLLSEFLKMAAQADELIKMAMENSQTNRTRREQ